MAHPMILAPQVNNLTSDILSNVVDAAVLAGGNDVRIPGIEVGVRSSSRCFQFALDCYWCMFASSKLFQLVISPTPCQQHGSFMYASR